jgi:hypothetical protein
MTAGNNFLDIITDKPSSTTPTTNISTNLFPIKNRGAYQTTLYIGGDKFVSIDDGVYTPGKYYNSNGNFYSGISPISGTKWYIACSFNIPFWCILDSAELLYDWYDSSTTSYPVVCYVLRMVLNDNSSNPTSYTAFRETALNLVPGANGHQAVSLTADTATNRTFFADPNTTAHTEFGRIFIAHTQNPPGTFTTPPVINGIRIKYTVFSDLGRV